MSSDGGASAPFGYWRSTFQTELAYHFLRCNKSISVELNLKNKASKYAATVAQLVAMCISFEV